ncbi:hypothetical protein [Actinosynnema pretiosum]|uniref:Uncharacterized protein n=1 Tax=Actinosynnema pretiosum TaxID=42197 RepID=A0A290Z8U3_9PSEU|nr:hypothetical protein [Actinosynnema pretiosum]ATE55438.1 hypothetical protein CNX65_20905 [Actinosynnema pretiosum]
MIGIESLVEQSQPVAKPSSGRSGSGLVRCGFLTRAGNAPQPVPPMPHGSNGAPTSFAVGAAARSPSRTCPPAGFGSTAASRA